MTNHSPYETSTEGGARAFLAVQLATGATAYLPWHALRRMALNETATALTLEFAHESVELTGSGLSTVAELAAGARLKRLRAGASDEVRIASLRVVGDNL